MTNHLDQTNERKEVGKRQTTQKEKKKKRKFDSYNYAFYHLKYLDRLHKWKTKHFQLITWMIFSPFIPVEKYNFI